MNFCILHIEFRSPNVAKSHIKKPYLLRQAVARASHMSLSDLNIDLFGLSYSRAQVIDFLQTLHKRALRKQIADNSANKGSGWSGTL